MIFLQANRANYASPRTHAIDHIVIHYTGNASGKDTATTNATFFRDNVRNESAHYFVDENQVVQSVKEGDRAFHCGDKTMNDRSIGIEMCSRKDAKGQWYIPSVTIKRTVELVQELMLKYAIPLDNVLRHYDVNGKRCPEPFVRNPSEWKVFLEELNPASLSDTDWCIRHGIFKGDGRGNYRWKDCVTREELAIVLRRVLDT